MAALILRLVVSLVAAKAESECSSLLMSKQRSSIEFQDGKCIEQDGDRHTEKHDNVVKFDWTESFQALPSSRAGILLQLASLWPATV